jgi:hypothetical protein
MSHIIDRYIHFLAPCKDGPPDLFCDIFMDIVRNVTEPNELAPMLRKCLK